MQRECQIRNCEVDVLFSGGATGVQMDYWAEREEDFVDVKYSFVSCIRPRGLGVEARNLDARGYADGTILAVVGGRMSERQILTAQQIADRTVWTVEETKDMRRVSGTVHEHFRIVIEGFRGGAEDFILSPSRRIQRCNFELTPEELPSSLLYVL
jgi:hypothetical protein